MRKCLTKEMFFHQQKKIEHISLHSNSLEFKNNLFCKKKALIFFVFSFLKTIIIFLNPMLLDVLLFKNSKK